MGFETRFRNKKVLVTGALGFIGSHLCRKLSGFDVELHGTSRRFIENHEIRMQWWNGSMEDIVFARKVITTVRPDYIFHLSGYVSGQRDIKYLIDIYNSLLTSTVNLLTIATETGCEKVVIAGSLEEPAADSPDPGSPYAAAKAGCRLYTRLFNSLYGTPVVNPRIFMVYGPGQTDFRKLIPYVISSLLKNEAPALSSGTREIDWIYIDDVIDGLMTIAVDNTINDRIFDIGTGKTTPVKEVINKIVAITGSEIEPMFGKLEDRPLERVVAARTNVNVWQPEISLDEGLARTVNWYREYINT